MAKFTFLEVHLDGAELTANAPGSGVGSDREPDISVGEVGDEEASSGRGRWFAALFGLVFLIAVAVLVKKKAGGGSEPVPELEGRE